MKKIIKQSLAAIMVVLMILTSVPLGGFVGIDMNGLGFGVSANANTVPASGSCGENVTYTYNSTTKELVISGTGAMKNYNYYESPFYNSNIESVVIKSGVTTIGGYAFSECYGLTSVTIPDSVTTICYESFAGCSSLTSVTIPDSVTTIGNSAFSNCSSLTSVTIPDSVTTIGDWAFDWCRSLTSITIPDSVTTIGERAFSLCDSLTSVTIGNSVTTIGDHAFSICSSLISVTIPNSVTTIGNSAFDGCRSLTSVTIPDSVTTIGDWAFDLCRSLTSVTIPDSVTTIGNYAFSLCDSLTCVTIGNGVTTIGEEAFCLCVSLTRITVDKDNNYFSSDEYGVMFDKNKTELVYYPTGKAYTEYTIPDSVTTIGEDAFSDCSSLTSVTIPDSVTTIGNSAFHYCDSLTNVYYNGTEEQWKKISIGSDNEELTSATIHFSQDTESGDANSDGYKLRLRSDGAYSDSIAVGEAISFWTFLYKGKERLGCERAYAISFDTPGIFEVTKTKKTSTSFDVTLKACKAGTTNMTVSDSETGAYVTISLKANNPIEVTTMDEVKNLAKEYQEGRLTHFYDYNGLYVDGYSYRKNNDGSYNVSMNVYNEKAHHGAAVSYDKDGNIVDYELIDHQDKLPTSLWDGLFDSFDLVNAQLEKLTDKYLYDETALTKKTRIDDLNVPDGGYFVISNNYLENEYVFFANSINVAIDLICAYSKVNKIDVPDELPEKATEKVLEKIFKDLGPDQIKTVFKKLVKNFAKDLTISNVDVFMSGLVSTFDEFEINIEEIIKDTLEDLMTDTEAHLDFAEDIVLTLFGADAIKTALSSLGYINTGIKLIDVFSSSLAPEIVVYTPAEKDTVRISNGVTVTSETPLASDYVLHTYVINEQDDVMTQAKPTIESMTSNYKMYDITLYKSGQATQPNSKITVMIPIPANYNKNNIQIYWYKDDGTLQLMNAVVKGDYAVFETDHLSYYVLVDTHTHSYEEVSAVNADCVNKGYVIYTCACGDTYTEDIPKLGHNFSKDFTIDKQATYTEAGAKSKHCLRSGCNAKSEVTAIPKLISVFKDNDAAKVSGKNIVTVAGVTVKQLLAQAGKDAVIKDSKGNVIAADNSPVTGMTLTMADGKQYTIVVFGDADGDGKVSAADARLALRASVGLENYKEDSAQYKAANVGSEDKLSAADARLILRASVGLEDPTSWLK